MKRLAAMILTATVVWGAATARAAGPLPLPTGLAPTTPQVPAPSIRGGAVLPVAATAAPAAGAVQTASFRPGALGPVSDWTRTAKAWCTDCAPAVRHPLPPVPDGAVRGAACAGGACAPAGGGHDGHCWNHFKDWLCFRNTPIHLGYTPTPRITPFYTYFPTTERAGYAGGNCGPGGCAPGHPRFGAGLNGARGCTTCPQPGEAVMPGFRLAAPTANAPAPVAAPAAELMQSGFRLPPYRQTGTTPAAGR